MVLNETFNEIRGDIKTATTRAHAKTQAVQANSKGQPKKDAMGHVPGELWKGANYGAPYPNPRLDANRVYKLPARRARFDHLINMVYGQKEKIYKHAVKSVVSLVATVSCFVILAPPLALLGILGAASTGYFALRYKQENDYLHGVLYKLQFMTFINVEGKYDPVTKPPFKFQWIGK